ncbi:hypothetical protein HK105_202858 [Polyrhizophydium stewartii]|uniref:Uncharacterized protein n=1 Tax=Polyrhizophydium stewartii TaxID=2732419 RepID=A0ABR4NDG8_9FUNG
MSSGDTTAPPLGIEYRPAESSSGPGDDALQATVEQRIPLDGLGPVVVNLESLTTSNKDGTLSRISNWQEMSEIERNNIMRVLPKRNLQRLEKLRAQQGAE